MIYFNFGLLLPQKHDYIFGNRKNKFSLKYSNFTILKYKFKQKIKSLRYNISSYVEHFLHTWFMEGNMHPPWNFNFHIWCKKFGRNLETW